MPRCPGEGQAHCLLQLGTRLARAMGDKSVKRYHLVLNRTTWFLVAEDPEHVIHRFATRKDAVAFSMDYIERNGGSLTIHSERGRPAEKHTSQYRSAA